MIKVNKKTAIFLHLAHLMILDLLQFIHFQNKYICQNEI